MKKRTKTTQKPPKKRKRPVRSVETLRKHKIDKRLWRPQWTGEPGVMRIPYIAWEQADYIAKAPRDQQKRRAAEAQANKPVYERVIAAALIGLVNRFTTYAARKEKGGRKEMADPRWRMCYALSKEGIRCLEILAAIAGESKGVCLDRLVKEEVRRLDLGDVVEQAKLRRWQKRLGIKTSWDVIQKGGKK